ncbi:MAG: carbonic anhydrase [Armatimonadetes bacterium]|nr:carbonic anhydrase [Armatimonadota bacterium]
MAWEALWLYVIVALLLRLAVSWAWKGRLPMSQMIAKSHSTRAARDSGPADAPESMDSIRQRLSEANAAYTRRHEPLTLPGAPRLALAIVACVDPRLTGRLEPMLGLKPGDATMVRVAGNTIGGTDDISRSLAVAVFEQGVRYVVVVGHTDCGVAKVEPLEFAERLSERGISRFALGALPLREWLGVFRNEAQNVRDTVQKLRTAPMLPKDVAVAGALLDVHTGELTWLDE